MADRSLWACTRGDRLQCGVVAKYRDSGSFPAKAVASLRKRWLPYESGGSSAKAVAPDVTTPIGF